MDELEQNSAEWLAWRRSRIGASDAPIILGVSPWKTRYQLWLEKTCRDQKTPKAFSKPNAAIERGNRFEGAVRSIHELRTGFDFPAAIVVHPEHEFIMCSLDGYCREENIISEYKVAGVDVFEAAKKGIVHEKYLPQVMHQLMVTGAKENHFVVARAEEKNGEWFIAEVADPVIVKPDLEYQKNLLFELVSFWDFVMRDVAPPLCDRDTLYPDDQSTMLLFARLKKLKRMLAKAEEVGEGVKLIKEKFDEVKLETIEHIEHEIKHPKVSAAGVSVSKNKNGSWVVRLE